MSILDSFDKKELTSFPGADLLRDAEDLHKSYKPGAVLAENVEFFPGQVRTRRGFVLFTTVAVKVERFHHWLIGSFSRLLYFSSNGGAPKVLFEGLSPGLPLADVVTGVAATAVDAVFTAFGSRLFFAFLKANGTGVDTARVWNGLLENGIPVVDNVFQPPLSEGGGANQFAISYAQPPTGTVTAGQHKFALVWKTRNGYQTKAVEANLPVTAAGSAKLTVTLNPVGNWAAWVSGVRLAMTTVQNPALFIFVGDDEAITGGTSYNVVFTINLDDTVIASTVDVSEATDWFSLLDNNNPAAPDTPVTILDYGNRMVWIADVLDTGALATVTVIYISNADEPQWITADRHAVYLPGRRQARAAFVLYDILYVLGPGWTYAFSDNTDFPATWSAATTIDTRIGALSQHNVTTNPSRGIAWVANRDGLYPFQGGSFPQLPSSYLQTPDWARINWTNPTQIQVIDDGLNDAVRVLVPLDGAATPTHWMSFDYTEGFGWWQVKYSLDNFTFATPGSLGIVLNPATNASELMLSSATVDGKVYRQMSSLYGDTTLYNDDSTGITSTYRLPPLPGHAHVPLHLRGIHARIGGSGVSPSELIALKVFNADQLRSVTLTGVATAVEDPEVDILRLFTVDSEAGIVEIKTTLANRWFILSRVIMYYKGWIGKR